MVEIDRLTGEFPREERHGLARQRRRAAVAARMAAAESAQVERWLERILTANSPDELFG